MSLSRLGTQAVVTLGPDACALDAARTMEARGVGSVLVVDGGGRPCGILTDRDLVLRVLLPGLDAASTPLSRVMSRDLVCAREADTADDAAWRMREHRVRRLPVLDAAGALRGIVTLDDLLGKVAGTRADVAELLAAFHAPDQVV